MNFFDNQTSNVSAGVAPLNLTKGDILDLTKASPSLKNVIVGCGWDANTTTSDDFDLDVSAFLLNENNRVSNYQTDVVYFRTPNQQGIYSEGDNMTGNGDGDDERIHVDLEQINSNVKSIVFVVNIYDCVKRRQTFGQVKNSYIRLLDAENNEKELCRFELKDNAGTATALIFAKLIRSNNGWSFEATGEALNAADLNQILMKFM